MIVRIATNVLVASRSFARLIRKCSSGRAIVVSVISAIVVAVVHIAHGDMTVAGTIVCCVVGEAWLLPAALREEVGPALARRANAAELP